VEIPERVEQIASTLRSKGLTPTGYAEVEEGYIIQVSESG
jgi:hypothetical protein